MIYLIEVMIVSLFIATLFSISKLILTRKNNKILEPKDYWQVGLVLYLSLLMGVTLFPVELPADPEPLDMDFVNLDILDMFNYGSFTTAVKNIIGNVLLFTPLIPLICLSKDSSVIPLSTALIISLGTSAIIELMQYIENINAITGLNVRMTDVSDLMLNTIGGIVGYIFIKSMFVCSKRFFG